jgi:hypothetical protein
LGLRARKGRREWRGQRVQPDLRGIQGLRDLKGPRARKGIRVYKGRRGMQGQPVQPDLRGMQDLKDLRDRREWRGQPVQPDLRGMRGLKDPRDPRARKAIRGLRIQAREWSVLTM